ncbi:glycosyltransferase family 4 protein [Paraflavisolibacter sp. H34]|uniref:glycosyltransferase family 4 protein n=1 Tax=Huijunlia imazamoxiresistens TaxID=3127457 RepID=UPI00301B38C2
MKVLISHPTGNANMRAAAAGFLAAGILGELNTAIATYPGTLLYWLSTFGPLSELRRRNFPPGLKPLTRQYPWKEAGRLAASRAGMHAWTRHEKGRFCIDAVYHSLDDHVGKRLKRVVERQIDAVYAYEDGALESFRKAKELGLPCFYDLPIGYWRAAKHLMEKEEASWPHWASTLTGLKDSKAKLARKDEELRLADRIFVASRFTATTLQSFPESLGPVEIIPYGFPPVCDHRTYGTGHRFKPLRLLFVGGLSQRKGIANLFAAVESLGRRVELTIVGNKASNDCPALDTALAKHRWIPSLPHAAVLELMQQHDVLVFPSLFEGFGLVITEAMSQGTPVITTDRTAGPDLIQQDENGWLVEAGSTAALQAAIEKLLQNPALIAKAGREARETAHKRPWEVYGKELAAAVMKHKKPHKQ